MRFLVACGIPEGTRCFILHVAFHNGQAREELFNSEGQEDPFSQLVLVSASDISLLVSAPSASASTSSFLQLQRPSLETVCGSVCTTRIRAMMI